jgi:hypothetical protein
MDMTVHRFNMNVQSFRGRPKIAGTALMITVVVIVTKIVTIPTTAEIVATTSRSKRDIVTESRLASGIAKRESPIDPITMIAMRMLITVTAETMGIKTNTRIFTVKDLNVDIRRVMEIGGSRAGSRAF